jgi:hypothetical protein
MKDEQSSGGITHYRRHDFDLGRYREGEMPARLDTAGQPGKQIFHAPPTDTLLIVLG